MGERGYENFESDAALNTLEGRVFEIEKAIKKTFTLDSEESLYDSWSETHIVANVNIILALCKRYHIYPTIKLAQAKKWRAEYLNTYDGLFGALEDKDKFIENRRNVIEKTFDELISLVTKINIDTGL
jgi:hypothetical protein